MGEHDVTEIQIVAHPDLAEYSGDLGYRVPPNAKPACSRSASHSITGAWRCPPPWRHTRVRGRGALLKSDVGTCPRTSFDGVAVVSFCLIGGGSEYSTACF